MLPSPTSVRRLAVCAGFALAVAGALPAQIPGAPAAAPAAAPAGQKGHEVAFRQIEVRDRIEADGVLVRTQRVDVRLLTAAGVNGFSQVGVPFLEADQKAELTALQVIGPDGKIDDVLDRAPVDVVPVLPATLPIHSDLRVLRAAVPALAVGDELIWETRVRAEPLVDRQVWTEQTFRDPEEAPHPALRARRAGGKLPDRPRPVRPRGELRGGKGGRPLDPALADRPGRASCRRGGGRSCARVARRGDDDARGGAWTTASRSPTSRRPRSRAGMRSGGWWRGGWRRASSTRR